MASLSEDDRKRGSKAIAEALMSDSAPAAAVAGGPAAAAALPANAKKLFCDNWTTVKSVLQVLRQFAPGFVKPLIDIVIKAGDALKSAIC
jgi:hypothetical protein